MSTAEWVVEQVAGYQDLTTGQQATITQALSFLNSLGSSRLKLGTQRVERALEALGNPHRAYPTIHVAGTNGKGSVVACLTAIAKAAGYSVGSTISPHLMAVNERVQLNGLPLEWPLFAEAVLRVKTLLAKQTEEELLTYFEFLVVLAFWVFAEQTVALAIIEVGLGGRLDATNVLETPLATVITSIGWDHAELLGDSLEAIATEKAGILKPAVPVVLGPDLPDEARNAIETVAKQVQVGTVLEADPNCLYPEPWPGLPTTTRSYRNLVSGQVHSTNLLGSYQRNNLATVLATVSVVNQSGLIQFTPAAVTQGLKAVHWQGRFQWHPKQELIIDGSHNEDGFRTLKQTLHEAIPEGHGLLVLLALKHNKPWQELLKVFTPEAGTVSPVLGIVCTSPLQNERGNKALFYSPMELRRHLRENLPALSTRFIWAAESPTEALWMLDRVKKGYPASKPVMTLVTGSLYLAGDVLGRLAIGTSA
jgi:dihydrofolate synthase / folylpolyglutamate synthase